MEQGKGSGIFYSLKQRLLKSNLTNKYCFKSKGPKDKLKSVSSHISFVPSNCENIREVSDSNSPILKNITCVSEPSITECIYISNGTALASSVLQTKRCDCTINLDQLENKVTSTKDIDDLNYALCSKSVLNVSNLPPASSMPIVQDLSNEICPVNGNHKNTPSDGTTNCGLMSELLKLSKYGWYWGSISKEEAEEKLTNQPDGAFLLRDSSADRFILSLSFRSCGKTLHTRIEYSLGKGQFSFYQQQEQGFSSIAELVEHSMEFSKAAVYFYSRPLYSGYPAFPVRLTNPVSRFAHVRSLQHLCRFVIRESIRSDNIQKLPLPTRIKGYIEEGYY